MGIPTKSSTLHLEEFLLTRFNLDWHVGDGKNTDDCLSEAILDYDVARHNEQNHTFRLTLSVALAVKDGCTGVAIDCRIVGFFLFPEDEEETNMEYLVRVNGATILYGILRGQIAMVSGSFPKGKFNLPAVVMQDVLLEVDRKRTALASGETSGGAADPVDPECDKVS